MPSEEELSTLFSTYSAVLTELADKPYDYDLHVKHISLSQQLGDMDALESAREMMQSSFPLSEALYLDWLTDSIASLSSPDTFDALLSLFDRALDDYLSIPIAVLYSQFLLTAYYAAHGLEPPSLELFDDDDPVPIASLSITSALPSFAAVFPAFSAVVSRWFSAENAPPEDASPVPSPPNLSIDALRFVSSTIISRAQSHISHSHLVWSLWRDFEVGICTGLAADRDAQMEQILTIDDFFRARLSVPHLTIEATFAAYSRFVTHFDNDNYEQSLSAASAVYSPAAEKSNERFGQETALAQYHSPIFSGRVVSASGETARAIPPAEVTDPDQLASIFRAYIAWETGVPKADPFFVAGLYERAVTALPRNPHIWESYLEFVKRRPADVGHRPSERAVRFIPSSARLWAAHARRGEKEGRGVEAAEEAVAAALATRLFDTSTDDLVLLFSERVAAHRRLRLDAPHDPEDDPAIYTDLVYILNEGIERIQKAQAGGANQRKKTKKAPPPRGDPHCRLEKQLIHLYTRAGQLDDARAAWQALSRAWPQHCAIWCDFADFERVYGTPSAAHAVYLQGSKSRVDYPGYLLDAWVAHAREYGTLDEYEYALTRSARLGGGPGKSEGASATGEAVSTTEAVDPGQGTSPDTATSRANAPATGKHRLDTAKEDSAEEDSAKRAKRDHGGNDKAAPAGADAPPTATSPPRPKRDREGCTVFVSVSSEVSLDDQLVDTIFHDCGKVRESQIKTIGTEHVGLVEFADAAAVPLALAKSGTLTLGPHTVHVHLAWESCLYVTNYPESYDKEQVEALFRRFGPIFDTRWPSRRIRNTRRFCYVQFTTAEDARSALELHGLVLDECTLNVYISDPARRQERSDAGKHATEVYVTNFVKTASESDIRRIFATCGAITSIRLPRDPRTKQARGFCFIDFATPEGVAEALKLNNHEHKGRHLSVTVAQQRATGTQRQTTARELRGGEFNRRTLYVSGIPEGTQEALVQQAVERIVRVKGVIMQAGAGEAVIECLSERDVGTLLLHHATEPLTINGASLVLESEDNKLKGLVAKNAYDANTRAEPRKGEDAAQSVHKSQLLQPSQLRRRAPPQRGPRHAVAFPAAEARDTGGDGKGKTQDDFRAMLLGKKSD